LIGCIIQARVNSTRFPKKILQNLDGKKCVLDYVINQVKNSKKIDQIIIATTSLKDDDIVIDISEKNDCQVFRGDEDDVLDRYFQCARKFELDAIVRITSDCPLIDPQIIDQVIGEFESGSFDYVTNTFPRTFPKGLDVEIFSRETLDKMWKNAELPSEREHVTQFIFNSKEFRIGNVNNDSNLSNMRWTLDEREDLEFLVSIIKRIKNEPVLKNDVLEILSKEPSLLKVNSEIDPDYGIKKSREKDINFLKRKHEK
jgi:spore coat polysaccharide biosynthesis protein SpsF